MPAGAAATAAAAADVGSGTLVPLLLGLVATVAGIFLLATSLLTRRLRGPQRPASGLTAVRLPSRQRFA